jgi:hypothetical protein
MAIILIIWRVIFINVYLTICVFLYINIGVFISTVNRANVLEMQGYYFEAKATFMQALQMAEAQVIEYIILIYMHMNIQRGRLTC